MDTFQCVSTWTRFLAFSPSASRPLLALSAPDDGIKVWNPVQGTLVKTLESSDQWLPLAFVPIDHKPLLALGSVDGTVSIWDPTSYFCLLNLNAHSVAVASLSASPSGLLASGSFDGTIKICDPCTGTQWRNSHRGKFGRKSGEGLDTTQTNPPRKQSLVPRQLVSCDNNHVALLSEQYSVIEIWDAAKGTLLQALSGHEDDVNAIAISHKTNKLASASGDRTVKVWDAPTSPPVCVHTLRGHTDAVHAVAFSEDGLQLASASKDKTVMVWSITTGACTKTMQFPENNGPSLMTFANDGKHLAISYRD
ncbi:hypothetical protein NM208_g6690 [Fusarium decemcellulare]|uniref:Uncharacterized protein n=1 Tax=Fusarium decemcellulare TaxID=57161 RepID=A0ACC1SC98_9HYPO|nr:hypothetical protein NM208_g6690 [Fusarium decemcellulare]